jgi:hypothetical protein
MSRQPPPSTPVRGVPQGDARLAVLHTVLAALSDHAAPATSPHPGQLGQEPREPSVFDGDTRVLIPLGEFAQRMGISAWLAYKLARSGRLPTTRPGKRELYVPMAAARRIERDGLPPEGGEVA